MNHFFSDGRSIICSLIENIYLHFTDVYLVQIISNQGGLLFFIGGGGGLPFLGLADNFF